MSLTRFEYAIRELRVTRERLRNEKNAAYLQSSARWAAVDAELMRRRGWKPDEWTFFDALHGMIEDPPRAMRALERHDDLFGWMYQALLYLVSETPSPARDEKIEALVWKSVASVQKHFLVSTGKMKCTLGETGHAIASAPKLERPWLSLLI